MKTYPTSQPWQLAMKQAFRNAQDLLQYLEVAHTEALPPDDLLKHFPLLVTQSFASRMKKGDPHDPLLLQVLVQAQEGVAVPGFSSDPIQEQQVNPIPGLLHKYHNRLLVTVTKACAIHCRYCFRRHFPYQDNALNPQHWSAICAYIEANKAINEVIFSGGDPLMLHDDLFEACVNKLAHIPHLKRLRIHTRLPIVLPERVTPKLIHILKSTALSPMVVLHTNHAQEIDQTVQHALKAFHQARIPLLNQSVLLKNINDQVGCLVQLSEALYEAHVMPYYIHVLDKVQGAAHFNVTQEQAQDLLWHVGEQLPGYLVPRLVKEVPGAHAKQIIAPLKRSGL